MPRVLPQHTSQPIPEHPHHNGLTSVALRVCSKVQEYVGEGIQNGRVHGCTGYTHTKGERGLSLEFTDSILGKLKTAGILTRLVRCALALTHTPSHSRRRPDITSSHLELCGVICCGVACLTPHSQTLSDPLFHTPSLSHVSPTPSLHILSSLHRWTASPSCRP